MATVFRPPIYTRTVAVRDLRVDNPPNLLETTLGFTPQPFSQSDYPNPLIPRANLELRVFDGSLNLNLIGQDKFFGLAGHPNFDQPNPRGPTYASDLRVFDGSVNLELLGKDQFFGAPGQGPAYDWPNPTLRLSPFAAITSQPPINLLGGTLARPGSLLDWPNPRGPVWSNDVRAGFTNSIDLDTLGTDRFFGLAGNPTWDFPNPRGAAYPTELRVFDGSINLNLLGKDAFFGLAGHPTFDQPNPILRTKSVPEPFLPSLNLTTLPPATIFPAAQYDWPNPRGATYPSDLRVFVGDLNLELIGKDKFYGLAGSPNFDQPNPLRQAAKGQADGPPNLLETTLAIPIGSSHDWQNPARTRIAVQPEQVASLLETTLAVPIGFSREWVNPNRRLFAPIADTFPNLLTGTLGIPPAIPTGQHDWPNPRGSVFPSDQRGFTNSVNLNLIGKDALPGRQLDWPNPTLRLPTRYDNPVANIQTLAPVAPLIDNRDVTGLPSGNRLASGIANATRTATGRANGVAVSGRAPNV